MPTAPNGSQTAFLQTGGQTDQTFSVSADGTYSFSFQGALQCLPQQRRCAQQLAVYIDGTLVNVYSPTSSGTWDSFNFSKSLASGTHTLSFHTGVTSGDTTAFLDNVAIAAQSVRSPNPPVPPLLSPTGALNLQASAALPTSPLVPAGLSPVARASNPMVASGVHRLPPMAPRPLFSRPAAR